MPEFSESEIQAINEALFRGEKILAIKLYREATGKGLKESKDFVEELERNLRAKAPERFTAPPRNGCLGGLLFVLTCGAVVARHLFATW